MVAGSIDCFCFLHGDAIASFCAAWALLHTGEEARWTLQSKEFDAQIQRLTGDCAVASAFVSYLGPFNKEFRELLMTRDFYGDCIKLSIPVTQNIEVRRDVVVMLWDLGHATSSWVASAVPLHTV
jgi:hypothetical protein